MQYFPSQSETRRLSTDELRDTFVLSDLFIDGKLSLRVTDLDRAVVGGAIPTSSPLELENPAALRAEYFMERRELGVLNIGGDGTVTVDDVGYDLAFTDALYIGRGSRSVRFMSHDAATPARFYLVSYPAHTVHPTSMIRARDAQGNELGTPDRANKRRIARYIHAEGVRSAQLVMGVTVLETGSVWNTMPPHTHSRRSEIYMYFTLPDDAMVVHLMGEPQQVRSLIVRDGEAVLSPGWSIHSGCGTSSYAFCWAMGGENQDYGDMDPVKVEELR
ncbi:MAG TPA: 5-dehydro-4-deoxy-D-glucuronate isomerase [Gemmatimonadaceae bacterium]|nr:5-dehydro-4-deoxy-D-glucuronate isomerase [Gemmatimonadaceae bacterium]